MQRDCSYMRQALAQARRVWGGTSPNPAVGCVLVSASGQVLAAAHTAAGGRPHAETQALEQAGATARGATAYVTLEPCAHHAATPPCSEALIAAGVARVVIACRDADPRVSGKGSAMLAAAGIEVCEGVCETEGLPLYAGFFSRIKTGLPEINLKVATSLDGKIIIPPESVAAGQTSQYHAGGIRWITGEAARRHVHLLRAQHEAILTGIGTVLADDPQLTCRLPGMHWRSPLRAVMDSALRIPPESALMKTARQVPLVIFTKEADSIRHRPYSEAGAEVEVLAEMTLEHAARALAARGVSRLMVEAGKAFSSHTMMSGLLSRLYWYRAPLVIGADALPVYDDKALICQQRSFTTESSRMLGDDRLDVYLIRK